MANKKILAFSVIELHFYDDLSWEVDKIIRCLEFIRLNINDMLFKHKHSKFYIIKYSDFLGNTFPVIGVVNTDPIEANEFDDFDGIFEKVKEWVNSIGLNTIDEKSKELNVISWTKLIETGYYPDNADLQPEAIV